MAKPRVYEGTGEELEPVLTRHPKQRFRLMELADENDGRPLYEKASPEEWARAFREWAESHTDKLPSLPDEAISRESIYEGRG
jgi:hypothetical protein